MLNLKKSKKKKRDTTPKANISKRISIRANLESPTNHLTLKGKVEVEDEKHLPTFLESAKAQVLKQEEFVIHAIMPTVKTYLDESTTEQALMSLTDILHLVKHSKEEQVNEKKWRREEGEKRKERMRDLEKREGREKERKESEKEGGKKKRGFF
ncbi:hypothetical protein TrLO_g11267 [Triparma laevis f. longispina]|uniref:Uncharacterized protein n=1 Tax=Triparma laevis f. longispina TaxID=1714387 RepID=A0A9W7ABP8_9STRA|nr:hypothetical protein TrLO_g11267 [Triparma laevis f. longispina]